MSEQRERIAKIIGIGGASNDGHVRITRGDRYHLVQGSEQSHDAMIIWCEEINRRLSSMNKSIDDLSVEEFMTLAKDAAPPA
ncbi:MAG TPA: hypothetical protein PJ991_08350 [Kiritimatiellia bacterium]|nr:hypothetical protein [Kiritimatiellia bacterium]